MFEKLLNPGTVSGAELEQHVRDAVRGSSSDREAEEKAREAFLPAPSRVWTKGNGAHQVTVFIQPTPGATHHEVICDL